MKKRFNNKGSFPKSIVVDHLKTIVFSLRARHSISSTNKKDDFKQTKVPIIHFYPLSERCGPMSPAETGQSVRFFRRLGQFIFDNKKRLNSTFILFMHCVLIQSVYTFWNYDFLNYISVSKCYLRPLEKENKYLSDSFYKYYLHLNNFLYTSTIQWHNIVQINPHMNQHIIRFMEESTSLNVVFLLIPINSSSYSSYNS